MNVGAIGVSKLVNQLRPPELVICLLGLSKVKTMVQRIWVILYIIYIYIYR